MQHRKHFRPSSIIRKTRLPLSSDEHKDLISTFRPEFGPAAGSGSELRCGCCVSLKWMMSNRPSLTLFVRGLTVYGSSAAQDARKQDNQARFGVGLPLLRI